MCSLPIDSSGPNGNSIFLPAAGLRDGTATLFEGVVGYYWSSTLSSSFSYYARNLGFDGGGYDTDYDVNRRLGQSVRPVTE